MKRIEFKSKGSGLVSEVLIDGVRVDNVRRASVVITAERPPEITIEITADKDTLLVVEGITVTLDAHPEESWAEPWTTCEECERLIASNIDVVCSEHEADWKRHLARATDVSAVWRARQERYESARKKP